MFEVNGEYANRKGRYTVVSIDPPRMHIRYEDGTYSELNMSIQGRIWENIRAEEEAKMAKASRSAKSAVAGKSNQHYIKAISLPAADELAFPGWSERVVMANNPIQAMRIKPGDRVIYYGIETKSFFAVATITGEPFKANPKDYFYTAFDQEVLFFAVDLDVAGIRPDLGIFRSNVELEDYQDFAENLAKPEAFTSISEDDFELLAELLTELDEADSNDVEDDDFEEEDED